MEIWPITIKWPALGSRVEAKIIDFPFLVHTEKPYQLLPSLLGKQWLPLPAASNSAACYPAYEHLCPELCKAYCGHCVYHQSKTEHRKLDPPNDSGGKGKLQFRCVGRLKRNNSPLFHDLGNVQDSRVDDRVGKGNFQKKMLA